MSGDVQPRKRKDKKKKRDDDEPKEKSAPVHAKMGPDDIQLHVHSDHGTGGHWCAKILFFSLMAVLVGLIGLILLETRGVSDLDTPLSESRFADYLEGWVDEKRESHDDHDVLEALQDELDEHGDEPFEEEEAGHDDDDDDHDQEHDNDSNEEEDDEVDGNHDEDDAQENDNDNTNDDDDDDDTPREENDLNDEDDDSRQEESDNRNEEDVSKEENDNGNENDDEDDDSAGDFSENGGNEDADDNEIENDDNDDTDEGFEDQLGDDSIDADDNRPFEEEDDSDDASNEQFIDNDQGEDLHLQKLTEKEAAEQQNEEDEQDTSSSLTVKLGVGLALVVVAHLVLVKRSKSNEEEKIESPPIESIDLKRRFTLITPTEPIPSDVDDEQPNEEEDDEYEEDDLKGREGDERDEDEVDEEEIVEGNENEEEYEDENENSENSAESEEEIEDIENIGEEEVDVVDTFTEMKNMYRPKNDKPSGTNDEVVDVKEESKEIIDLDESDAEEDIEGSENSEDIEEEEDEEEISDVDDEDLMKRLESKYGKLPETKNSSDEEETDEKWTKVKRSGAQQDDDEFEDELRRTNEMLYDNPTSALKSFDVLIEIKPNSSQAWYGKGRALDQLSDEQKSNEILKEAIAAYVKAVEFGSSVDDETFKIYAERCIDRMRFIGQHLKAVPVHEALIERFKDDPYYRNQLAVTYLLINRLADAKLVLHETLLRWRHDGYALVHYGFILKNLDKNNEAAVAFLQEGIDTEAEGTNDGRFYFNLGEALTRLGRNKEAMAVYRKGASKKLFLSEYQRSLYNVDRLKSRPFWTKKQTGYKQYLDVLQQNWEKIRDEGLSVLNDKGHFTDESENLRDVGDWKQFDLFARGRKIGAHCARTPFTCKIIETFPAARFCKRGQVKFSVMHPGTHVWPHCGPTNCRIRAHLGLKVPEKTFIRVATETR
ncbi:hypothetical protein HA402_000904 [Bradysia odoriphaga]|nr:hypothetical protein HA402_000904 [Bradysia odoriphaga]